MNAKTIVGEGNGEHNIHIISKYHRIDYLLITRVKCAFAMDRCGGHHFLK